MDAFRFGLPLLLLAVSAHPVNARPVTPAKGAVYTAPTPEPTPEETLILELMNRFRADPVAEMKRIAPPGKSGGGVDWDMFRREMRALSPRPPLVFNLRLLDAARKHSHYNILNGMTHVEQPGRPGFVAASFGDRCKRAGYHGSPRAENVFTMSGGPLSSHVGFLVDRGKGPGGMQPERGHRKSMIGSFREVGPGALPHGRNRLSVTHNFGTRDVRFAGGVTYIDLNRNDFYDIGEGIGDVTIRAGNASCRTWSCGAYTLELRGCGAVTIDAEFAGKRITEQVPAGSDNVKFDWAIPEEIPLKTADKLLSDVEKAGEPGTTRHFRALVALDLGTRGLYLDEDRKAKVERLTREVRPALTKARNEVLSAIRDPGSKGLQQLLHDRRRPYLGTVADDWFRDAELVARMNRGVQAFLKQSPSKKARENMAAYLERSMKSFKTSYFDDHVKSLIARVKSK